MNKNIVKIILDIVMTLLLLLMYSKSVISMSFHEVGGLIVCGLFFINKMLNWRWIIGVTKRLMDKSLPKKTRVGYLVNVLLFVSTTFIAVSGIMISKTLFKSIFMGGLFWKMGHFFAAAIDLVLVGVHIGLHWTFIKNMFKKIVKLPKLVGKPLGIICLAIMLIYGGYSMVTTSFTRWLVSPFTAFSVQNDYIPQKDGERPEGIHQKSGERPKGMALKGEKPEGFGRPEGELGKLGEFHKGSSARFGRIFEVITSYGSITSIFATLTIAIEKILTRRFFHE